MAINYVPLDKNKHSDWKVSSKIDLAYAAKTHLAAATIREYAQLSGSMPIVFIEDPQSKNVHSVAMLGLEQGSNLFFAEDKWQGPHVPLNIQRYPFDIRPDGDKLGVFIDEESDLVIKDSADGQAMFAEEGEPSEYLKNRQQFLSELANSEVQNQRFIKQLQENELLEEIQILVNYASGQKRNVTGILSVSEKKLLELSDEKILAMHKAGYLGAVYSVMLSLGQLNRLVELSNKSDNPIQSLQLAPAAQEQAEATTNA